MANDLEKILGKIGRIVLNDVKKKVVKKRSAKKVSKKITKKPVKTKLQPMHPWRLCPVVLCR